MPVTEFIVENVSNVVNPPGKIYDVAGVDIAPGESRNLLELGATLEQIARDESLTAGLIAGDLIGPAQTWYYDAADNGAVLVPGGVYLYAPDAVDPGAFDLPEAKVGAQVPLPVEFINASAQTVALSLAAGDSAIPPAPLVIPAATSARLFTFFDGSTWGWTLTLNS